MYIIPPQPLQAADSIARSGHESVKQRLKAAVGSIIDAGGQDHHQWQILRQRQFSDNASKNADIRTGIIVGVVLGVALIAFVAFVWVYRASLDRMARRKKKKGHRPRSGSSSKSSKSSKSSDAGAPPPAAAEG